MRGKKPKERKNYILRTENGTLVEVTREVYLEWYQSVCYTHLTLPTKA